MLARNRRLLLTLAALAGSSAFAGAAVAQSSAPNTPSAVNQTEGAGAGLGSSHRFATSAAAAAHCPGDKIVWSTGKSLTYMTQSSSAYGQGSGFYACRMEAKGAGFHRRHD